MSRRITAVLILLAWLGSLGWLAARRRASSEIGAPEATTGRLVPGASFFSVRLGGTQIGTAGITYDTLKTGFQITEVLSLDLATPRGEVRRDVMRREARLSADLALLALEVRTSEDRESRTTVIRPSGDSAVVVMTPAQGGLEAVAGFEAEGDPVIADMIPLRLAARGLREGLVSMLPTLDPLLLTAVTINSRVGPDTTFLVSDSAVQGGAAGSWRAVTPTAIRAWPVINRGGLAVVSWVDRRGQLVRRAHAFGLTLERSPFEVNYTGYQREIRNGTVVPPVSLPGSRRLVQEAGRPDTVVPEVRVVVGRADGVAWPGAAAGFGGGRQTVSGDTVLIVRHTPPGSDSTPPRHLRNIRGLTREDSLALQGVLRSALRSGSGAPDTVRRLVGWVARAVQHVDRPTVPTGIVTAARERRASLEGRVELLVALCRLAGIPARAVSGVDLLHPGLPAHVWAEVWRNGWMAVDPMFGDVPASASLLRVAEGAAARPLALVPLIGSLRTTLVVPGPAPRRQ